MPFAVEHLRADGDVQLYVVAGCAVLAGTTPGAAAARRVLPPGSKAREITQVWIGDEHYVTARTTVTPVGSSTRYVLLAPEAERAVSTTPGDRRDAGAVVEHRCLAD
jgi:hypothetical protein